MRSSELEKAAGIALCACLWLAPVAASRPAAGATASADSAVVPPVAAPIDSAPASLTASPIDSAVVPSMAAPVDSAAPFVAGADSLALPVPTPADSALAGPSRGTTRPESLAVRPPPVAPAPPFERVEISGAHAVGESEVRQALAVPIAAESLGVRLRRVGRLYYDRGYVQATFTPQRRADGGLQLAIHEGALLRLSQLYVRGAQAIPETVAREILALRPGEPFRAPEIEVRLRALVDEYARRGYLDAEAALERLEITPEGAVVGVAIAEGARATLAEVTVQGNSTTRAALVQRIAGLHTPQPADAGRIREAPQLLRRSGLFAAVGEPVLYRAGGGVGEVGVVLHVVESERRNSVFGAFGVARDPSRGNAYLTGTVDLALRNIYGSGRDLRVGWQRDARLGSRLQLGYRERYLFGSPVDLAFDLSQTVRDSTSTWQTLDVAATLPLNRNLALEGGGAFDRSVYHLGVQGNTLRLRGRIGVRFASLRREGDGGSYGSVEVKAEWGRRRNDLVGPAGADHDRVQQTIWGGRFECGVALALRHALAARGEWHVLDGGGAPVPDNELYEFGGAQTLRGYRENQFRGDRVAYGGLEYRYGNPLGARVYAFVDAGVLGRRTGDGNLERSAHMGTGVGLRAAMANGTFDLAFGIGEERSLSDAKVHASLVQHF